MEEPIIDCPAEAQWQGMFWSLEHLLFAKIYKPVKTVRGRNSILNGSNSSATWPLPRVKLDGPPGS